MYTYRVHYTAAAAERERESPAPVCLAKRHGFKSGTQWATGWMPRWRWGGGRDRVGSSVASLKPFPKERMCPPPVRLSLSFSRTVAQWKTAPLSCPRGKRERREWEKRREKQRFCRRPNRTEHTRVFFLLFFAPSFLFLSLLPLVTFHHSGFHFSQWKCSTVYALLVVIVETGADDPRPYNINYLYMFLCFWFPGYYYCEWYCVSGQCLFIPVISTRSAPPPPRSSLSSNHLWYSMETVLA